MKKNYSLIIGLAIPVFMILFVAGSIYLPGLFVKAQYDFLYVIGNNYYPIWSYSVEDNKIVREEYTGNDKLILKSAKTSKQKLYWYNIKERKSTEITLEKAEEFKLDPSNESPDGFEVVPGSRGDGIMPFIFFASKDYSTRYIKGHGVSRKLNIVLGGKYYSSRDFELLGWIID